MKRGQAGGLAATQERVACGECALYTTRQAMGAHRKHTGHGLIGWTPPAPPARTACEVCGKTSPAGGMATHRKYTGHGLSVPAVVVVWEEGVSAPLNLTVATCGKCGLVTTPPALATHMAVHRLPPRFRCSTCGHLTGDLDEAEAHRRFFAHLLYSEKGVSEVWYYDLPNEAALFADA